LDHYPLFLDSGEETVYRQARFYFQTWWCEVVGFGELITGKITHFLQDLGPHRDSVDLWQCVSRNVCQFLKGWGANLGKEKRECRANLLAQVVALDRATDSTGLDEEAWALRYFLEDQLVGLDRLEEEYWR
jgi:hypothetical protein